MTNEFERAVPETPAKKTRRRLRDPKDSEPKTDQPIRWVQLRIIPIWLRVILVIILWIVIAAVGLTIGYSSLGDGQAKDALKWGTWQHLLDIMNGKK
ncbi:DNA-directed RNA polymerase subunit beta [Lysinibacillus sp. 2017]|uniref:DNA-directed RNA polymerase subunit beta n=1 Tax=unclassified Lysinibacillus TaxID=2636778 RepID=UPI000D527AF1|nr:MULTISPECIES: DNA-directed RNA polymerase subunit beta [unclassified Lysinibacillus]AWE06318.1 DNA-directed RNA polymerase subunit beta [Lysinibacillus sp. 2017]TGN35005.1 DNA-directed RNA polymerase subunit beta [Lysinibacillus sp. S2017]